MQIIISEFTPREISTVNKCIEHMHVINQPVTINGKYKVYDVYGGIKVCRFGDREETNICLLDCDGRVISMVSVSGVIVFETGKDGLLISTTMVMKAR